MEAWKLFCVILGRDAVPKRFVSPVFIMLKGLSNPAMHSQATVIIFQDNLSFQNIFQKRANNSVLLWQMQPLAT